MLAFLKPKDLNRGQHIGDGQINVYWPGLNASAVDESGGVARQRYLQPDPHRTERMLESRKETKLIKRRSMIHPMERGYSGRSLPGRTVQPPPPNESGDFSDYTTVCLKTKMATVMTTKGRSRNHTVLLAIGNHNGLLGFCSGISKDPKSSMKIALNDVGRRLQYIHRLEDHTVYHDFYAQCCGVRIFVQRKPKGFGLRCHRVIQTLCKLCGITDLHAKVDGNTRNYGNIAKAFITGLLNQETHQELAERKRLHVVEFKKENGYLPRIVASPRLNKLRTDEEIDKDEVLDVEDMYGENKLPYNKPTFPKPFYLTTKCPSYSRKLYIEHPYRNMNEIKRRLMASGVLIDGSKQSRSQEAKLSHERVILGERPMPLGFGLPGIFRDSLVDEEK